MLSDSSANPRPRNLLWPGQTCRAKRNSFLSHLSGWTASFFVGRVLPLRSALDKERQWRAMLADSRDSAAAPLRTKSNCAKWRNRVDRYETRPRFSQLWQIESLELYDDRVWTSRHGSVDTILPLMSLERWPNESGRVQKLGLGSVILKNRSFRALETCPVNVWFLWNKTFENF